MKRWSISCLVKSVSVEPVIFLNAIAISFHNVVYGYGMYRVICQKMFADDPSIDCSDLSHHNSTSSRPELEVQKASADWQMATRLAYVIPATFADIFLGALGDRYGRKLNILLGVFGMMISVFPFAILFAYPKTMPLYVLLITYLIAGLTGFVAIIVISSFAYLADTVIDKDLLTVRMTLIQVFIHIGYIFGPLMAGAMSNALSSSVQECVALAVLGVSFIIGALVLRQIPPADMRKRMAERAQTSNPSEIGKGGETQLEVASGRVEAPKQSEAKPNNPFRFIDCWTSFVQAVLAVLTLMKEVWTTYTKPRQGHGRLYILAASVIFFVSLAAEQGLQTSLFMLYVQKAPLSWNQEMIGYYNSVNNGVTIAGTAAGIVLFKKLLSLADTTVLLIAMISAMIESLLIAFADDRTWVIFLSAVIGCVSTLVKPCLKSFVAKLVEPEEVGKAFTIFGVAQNLAYLVTSVVFNNMYKATLESFPGFVYVFAAFVQFLIFLLVFWVHVDQKRALGEKCSGLRLIKWIDHKLCKSKEPAQNPQVEVTVVQERSKSV